MRQCWAAWGASLRLTAGLTRGTGSQPPGPGEPTHLEGQKPEQEPLHTAQGGAQGGGDSSPWGSPGRPLESHVDPTCCPGLFSASGAHRAEPTGKLTAVGHSPLPGPVDQDAQHFPSISISKLLLCVVELLPGHITEELDPEASRVISNVVCLEERTTKVTPTPVCDRAEEGQNVGMEPKSGVLTCLAVSVGTALCTAWPRRSQTCSFGVSGPSRHPPRWPMRGPLQGSVSSGPGRGRLVLSTPGADGVRAAR